MGTPTFYDLIGFTPRHTEPRQGAPDAPPLEGTALFLDFDGTLVDIAERPDGIAIPDDLPELLSTLHDRTQGATVVVSGRQMADLERFLPGFPGVLVGSHGAEGRDGDRSWRHDAAESDRLRGITRMARMWAEAEPDVIVEEKAVSVALHFRQAPERMADGEKFLSAVVGQNPGFVLHHAKMALEVHPDDVCKREAVRRLARRWARRLPVAFGDDATDEGMFEAVNRRGGLSIKVGPGETAADWRLESPAEVRAALAAWISQGEAASA